MPYAYQRRRRRARRDGYRRIALGRPATRPPSPAPPSPRRATSAAAGAIASLVYETDSPMFPLAKATGLTVKDWQDLDHGQPVRQAVLERGRRLLQVLQRRHGLPRRQEQAQRRRADLGDLRCRWRRRARSGTPSRRTSIPTATSSAPIRLPSWPARIKNPVPEAADVRRGAAGDGEPLQFVRRRGRRQRLQASRRRCTRSRRRRSMRRGRRRSCTTRSPGCAPTPTPR